MPVGGEGGGKDVGLASVGGACEAAEHALNQSQQQQKARRHAPGGKDPAAAQLGVLPALKILIQSQKAQYRQGELQHHQRHGHGAELVVQRRYGEEQLGEPQEMAAQRQQHR